MLPLHIIYLWNTSYCEEMYWSSFIFEMLGWRRKHITTSNIQHPTSSRQNSIWDHAALSARSCSPIVNPCMQSSCNSTYCMQESCTMHTTNFALLVQELCSALCNNCFVQESCIEISWRILQWQCKNGARVLCEKPATHTRKWPVSCKVSSKKVPSSYNQKTW